MRPRALALTVPLLAVILVAASDRYNSPIDLGTLGGPYAAATGINNRGQVVGWAYRADNTSHAFLWWKGTMQDLGTLGGNYSVANAINEAGQAVGLCEAVDRKRFACLWESGRARALDPSMAELSEAFAINNSGDAGGYYYTGGFLRACVWRRGVRIDLGLPQQASSIANGINDAGRVTGWYFPSSSMANQCAFVWENGIWTTVGKCGEIIWASAINNRGDFLATGFDRSIAGANSQSYIFFASEAPPLKLGLRAWAINQREQVAGECDKAGSSPTPHHACIEEAGQITHFGADDTIATAINDSGDIVGSVWRHVGYRALLWKK